MAKIAHPQLLRARIDGWPRPPWAFVLLFAADLVELAGSLALAAMSPAPAPRVPYAAIDVPPVAPVPTLGVAMLGVAVGLVAFASLVGELVVMVRRAQILGWRYGKRRDVRAGSPT